MQQPINQFLWHYKILKTEGKSFEEAFGLTASMIADLGTMDDLKLVRRAFHEDIFDWFDQLEEEIKNENNQTAESNA